MPDARDILQRHGQRIDQHLSQFCDRQTGAPPKLIEAIRYSLLDGGKRLRPSLVIESCRCAGGDPDSKSVIAAACAMELIHTFSLVHDDLPAMDDDDLRRGKPTNHKVFGEAMAILAGDAMVTMAFEVIATDAEPRFAPQLIAELAQASGPAGMIGGQVLDMAGENQSLNLDQLRQIHRLKTGALLTTSCRLGAIAARADKLALDALTDFGRHLGLAFQIVDDLLDVTSTPQQLGKATNKDRKKGKNTYPALIGVEASQAEAREHLDAAIDAVKPFKDSADAMRCLAWFVADRKS